MEVFLMDAAVVTLGLRYVVKPEREAEFLEKVAEVNVLVQALRGHQETVLAKVVDQPCTYLVLSAWTDEQAFLAFLQSDVFNATKAWGRDVLEEMPRHTFWYPRLAENAEHPAH